MTLFAVKDIVANPFRHIERYPIKREKVEALRESLRTTGFWDNVVARRSNGKAEIAYGHHRLVALKEEFGPNHKVELIIRDLHDDTMIQIMARENMEEWGTSASVEHETVHAVVEALAEGKIKLAPVPSNIPQSQTRFAPSFIPGERGGGAGSAPYTAQSIAAFIGWLTPSGTPQEKVHSALAALQFIEDGLMEESDFEGLTTMQAQAVIEETRRAKKAKDDLARIHQQQAEAAKLQAEEAEIKREEAKRQAQLAEQRRKAAETERQQKEAEAKTARDAAARKRATEEAERLERERRTAAEEEVRLERVQKEAERARKQAETLERAERRKEMSSKVEARQRATSVGRAVSSGIKSGEIGYKRARDVAIQVPDKSGDKVPPDLEDYARRLTTDLNSILDPDRDRRVERLERVIPYREHLDKFRREDLISTLREISKRALTFAEELSGKGGPERPKLPSS